MSKIKNIGSRLNKVWKSVGEFGSQVTSKLGSSSIELMSRYSAKPRGIVKCEIIDAATGQVIGGFEDKNVIVDLARETMCKIITNDDIANRVLETISFSDGGHNPTTLEALVPTVGDTDLNSTAIASKTVSSGDITVTYPNNTTVRFEVTIPTNENQNETFSELALFSKNGVMFSHKTFGAIYKSGTSISLKFTYSILF